jgi:hypothetical protein
MLSYSQSMGENKISVVILNTVHELLPNQPVELQITQKNSALILPTNRN